MLYSGSAAVTNQLLAPNTFSQPVANADPVLPTGSTYRINLLYPSRSPEYKSLKNPVTFIFLYHVLLSK